MALSRSVRGLSRSKHRHCRVSGGNYTCTGDTAFAISCEHCSNTLIQNLSASGCGQGNIHFFAAGAAVEIKGVESSGSNRGVWSQTPSHKVLITDSFLHHNGADGVDLDSMSANVMVRNNRIENNHRAGVFIEEGASDNVKEFVLSRFVHCPSR